MKILDINQGDEFKDFLERLNFLQRILEQPELELEDNESVLEKFESAKNHFENICLSFEKRVSSRIDEIKITSLKTELHKIGRISQGKVRRTDEALDMVSDVINSILDFQRYLVDPFNFSSTGLRKLDIKPKDNATIVPNKNDDPPNIQSFYSPVKEHPKMKRVFISYNHKDVKIAERLHEDLLKHKIDVIRDQSNMLGGESIDTFIKDSIRNTDKTVSIVSSNSLPSAWVALETIHTFHNEDGSNSKFIGCAIDHDFFEEDFDDKLYQKIEDRIDKLSVKINKRLDQGRDQRDLSNELTRNKNLLSNVDLILQRLKEYLTLDFREKTYKESLEKLVKSIQH